MGNHHDTMRGILLDLRAFLDALEDPADFGVVDESTAPDRIAALRERIDAVIRRIDASNRREDELGAALATLRGFLG